MAPPFYIYLMLTEHCNYRCSFCIRNNVNHIRKDLSAEKIIEAMKILQREYPNAILVLTGGEPTMHPDFCNILNNAARIFKRVQITSNGSFGQEIAEIILPLLKQNVFLQMSIDGPKHVHDAIRGEKAFDRILQNVERMEEVWDRIGLAATVPPDNYEVIKELALFLNGLKFHSLKVVSVVDYSMSFLKEFSNDRWNHFVDEMLEICRFNLVIQKILDFELMDEVIETMPDVLPMTNCGRGKQQIYVDPNMDILPCTCQSETVGNVLTGKFEEIKQRIVTSGIIEISQESICYKCRYKNICNGGCPGYSTHFWGRPDMGDIRCPIVKGHYLNTVLHQK